MLTIDKKHKKEILAFQNEIKKQNALQDKKFARICKKLDIDPEGELGDCLFDYIYNDSDFTVYFTDEKKPTGKIY